MRQVIIKHEAFEEVYVTRMLKFINSKATHLEITYKTFRKHGKFLFVYIPNNRRIEPRRYQINEIVDELSLHLLLGQL